MIIFVEELISHLWDIRYTYKEAKIILKEMESLRAEIQFLQLSWGLGREGNKFKRETQMTLFSVTLSNFSRDPKLLPGPRVYKTLQQVLSLPWGLVTMRAQKT